MTEKWCEHCKLTPEGSVEFWYDYGRSAGVYKPHYDIKFCPTCGTPRPAPKSLEQVLRDRFWSRPVEFETWESIAKKAKELILDGKEEGASKILRRIYAMSNFEAAVIAKEILTYLRESC